MDPFKEGEARTTRLRTGVSTFKEECAKINKHWIRVLMQLAIERKVCKLLLAFSSTSRKQGTTGGKCDSVVDAAR
jgi:hypothetical protein